MYNPYNWTINKKKNDCVCILDELSQVCTSLDLIKTEHILLKKEIKKIEEKILELEEEKISLTKKILEHP